MNDNVYHFTTSAQLPWIIDSGELRQSIVKVSDFPNPDFIWATSDSRGDRTATGMMADAYRDGGLMMVRFTLSARDFFPWASVQSHNASWNNKHVEKLEKIAKADGVNPANWWCRDENLDLDKVLIIHWRSYANNTWKVFDGTGLGQVQQGGGLWRTVELGGKTYASTKVVGPQGQDAFNIGTIDK
ncbi:hypothetical protein J3U99_20640 [Brucella pituitosa]|uniref:hypothetical protein n=1 Tax=Brucella pituitosa TaxID=571256 RepID=UPI0020068DE0|nr:hypothetical protein [Brucella pituitosa]MCK4207180.1 hypothetical protein [Brucella pituitosa]